LSEYNTPKTTTAAIVVGMSNKKSSRCRRRRLQLIVQSETEGRKIKNEKN
jgi:hypothetical protein